MYIYVIISFSLYNIIYICTFMVIVMHIERLPNQI